MATRLTTILVAVIVGATFIAGLIVGAQRDDASGPVDLIIVNGKVYPGGGAELQEAVAVRGNQILRVGSNREVKRLRRAQTVVLDAHGATVLPGLNDSHVQLMAGALCARTSEPFARYNDRRDRNAISAHYAEEKPTRPWLIGRNGDADLLATANVPAREILDEAVARSARARHQRRRDASRGRTRRRSSSPASLVRRAIPESGIVVKDRRTGEPTGVLKDGAIELVTRVVPQPTRAEKLAALRAAIAEAHKLGMTSVQSVSATDEELELLNEIREQGELGVRVLRVDRRLADGHRGRRARAEQAARGVSRRSRVEGRRRHGDVPV